MYWTMPSLQFFPREGHGEALQYCCLHNHCHSRCEVRLREEADFSQRRLVSVAVIKSRCKERGGGERERERGSKR